MVKKKKRKKFLLVLLCILLVLYILFVATRFSPFTSYVPFSGRLFALEPEAVSTIEIRSINTGQWLQLKPAGYTWINGEAVDCAATLEETAALLNSFRYGFWLPNPFALLPLSDGAQDIYIKLESGESIICDFSENTVQFRGVIYFDRSGVMQRLFSLIRLPD